MNYKPIIIVAGEPNSIFSEIFFKSLKKLKIKKIIILITSLKLLKLQMNKLKYKSSIRIIDPKKLQNYKLDNKSINLININLIDFLMGYAMLISFSKCQSKDRLCNCNSDLKYKMKSNKSSLNPFSENQIKSI